MKHLHRVSLCITVLGLMMIGFAPAAFAQQAKLIQENQALDQQWLEAFNRSDLDGVMKHYWNSPNLVTIFPDGKVNKGWNETRQALQQFFDQIEWHRLEFTDGGHWVSGKDVYGWGIGTHTIKWKNGPETKVSLHSTDVRQKIGGKWVYVRDHVGAVPPDTSPRPTDSLYKRLGGYDALAAVTDDFLGRLLGDPQLKKFFGGVSTNSAQRIRQLVVDQLCAATGGPCFYIGRDMKASHAGLGISESDWDRAVAHLVDTLNKFMVPEREKSEVLAALSGLKKDIVEK
ncbi:MAG: DUF4440 domain-containing protein [Acidobacteriota bacterium]|nr:DUF4440 domain-containing protein [Blastocatellia bacterium]MDW8240033.1 DUF4440 domain-containing protein [Acidobacteriota bacterium]